MQKLLLFVAAILFASMFSIFLGACEKDDTATTYTIYGKLTGGDDGKPIANMEVRATAVIRTLFDKDYQHLDTDTTGEDGIFNLQFTTTANEASVRFEFIHENRLYKYEYADSTVVLAGRLPVADSLNLVLHPLGTLNLHLTDSIRKSRDVLVLETEISSAPTYYDSSIIAYDLSIPILSNQWYSYSWHIKRDSVIVVAPRKDSVWCPKFGHITRTLIY